MIRMRLLMAAIAIVAVSTTGCSPKVVGDSSTAQANDGTELTSDKYKKSDKPDVQGEYKP